MDTIMRPLGRKGLRTIARAAGSMTASTRLLPSALIVGAQRCGTTSMFKALSQHPAVLPPLLHKGVHYFDVNYRRGPSWYRSHFPLSARTRIVERQVGTLPITLESSPYYLFHPLAGERIAQDLPEVKILVLVRDPVERAYSAHTHETMRGYESEPFARALELEARRIASELARMTDDPTYESFDVQHHAYLARGRYAEQLSRLEQLMGRDCIHVVDSHRFFEQPQEEFRKVLEFLELPACESISIEKHNARARSPMDEGLRRELEEYFRPHDEELTHWLGQQPSWRA